MLSTILRFNNLLSPIKTQQPLRTSELPTALSSIYHNSAYKYSLEVKNTSISSLLNPYKIPNEQIDMKVVDVHYTLVKNKNIQANTSLDPIIPVGETQVVRLNIDPSKSTFFGEGIYSDNSLRLLLKIMNQHPCKATRLGNGKVRISHVTHNPPNLNNFTYVSSTDLNGATKPQFISNFSIELDENSISSIFSVYPNNNCVISIIHNNYLTQNISEESFFHYLNNKKYDCNLKNQVKDEIQLNIDLAMEILERILNS